MDNVTHALAGLLLADIAVRVLERRQGTPVERPVRRTAAMLGVVAAELPDLDILYSGPVLGMGKLGYLLHHRGHTHTFVVAVVAAFLLWGLTMLLQRQLREGPARRTMLGLALAGTLSHIALDFTNSYGVHPFWPLYNGWVYGDAVFIVEPWLWVLGIPPLLLGARSVVGRILLGLALVAMLVAAFVLGAVPQALAITLVVAALLWLAVMWRATVTVRLALSVAAWTGFETLWFAASSAARSAVERAVPIGLADVVLTAAAGNPLCFDAIVVEAYETRYQASRATVAAWPSVRDASDCGGTTSREAVVGGTTSREAVVGNTTSREAVVGESVSGLRGGMRRASRAPSAAVVWRQEWSAPLPELIGLARRCDVRAALGFMRVPVWEIAADGAVQLSDLRYGFGGDGFADLTFPAEIGTCPPFVPPWTPPRRAQLSVR